MKKTLIALAALAATSAFAQSTVTIAGIVDQAYYTVKQNSPDGTKNTKQTGFGEGSWAGSRLRFSGSEDMGGGLKANFWLEQGIAPSDAQGFNYRNGGNGPQMMNGAGQTHQNRQSYVGLSGGFGEVRVGRLYAAGYDMWTNTGHINGEFTGTTQAGLGLASRTKGLSYTSPAMSGFTFHGTMGGRDTETTNTQSTENQVNGYKGRKEDLTTARVMWAQGPARAGLVYEMMTQNFKDGTATANWIGVTPAEVTVNAAVEGINIKSNLTAFQAGYNLGMVDLGVLVGKKVIDNTIANVGKATTELSQINVKMPVTSALELRATYNIQNTENAAGVKTSDITGSFLNANYSISKRTRAYLSWGTVKDEAAGTAAAAVGSKETRSALGLVHVF
jgi:predicted porin